MFLTVVALVLLIVQSAFAQTEELPDTVWTKFTYPNAVNAVKFTPDGKYLASGGDDGIPKLWDAETGELVREFQGNGSKIWSLDINNTGEMLAIVNDFSEIFIWNIVNGDSIRFIDMNPKTKTMGGSLTFSNNGNYLAANLVKNGQEYPERDIYLFDTKNFDVISVYFNLGVATKMSFSPSDDFLAVSNVVSDKKTSIMIFGVPSLKPITLVGSIDGGIYQSALSPDGKYLAAAISGGPNKIWNTSDWSLKSEIGDGGDSRAIKFSPDGKYVVFQKGFYGKRHLQIWANTKLNYEYPISSLASSISISPDMKYIAYQMGVELLFTTQNGILHQYRKIRYKLLSPLFFQTRQTAQQISDLTC